jgi:zinc protease
MISPVERTQVGGVPVLRADLPMDHTVACLMFRVGRFDETLASSGITHMAEHLTLAGKVDAPYEFNASVNGRYTSFIVESRNPAHVSGFVADVCRGLVSDQATVLDQERRILRTEAASRGGAGALGTCLAERYGATGPGLANYEEFGLHRLGWSDVRAWRERWFTASNAVLWIAGPWPDGLRIELPGGPRPWHEPLRPLPLDLPGFTVTGRAGIGLSMVARRSVSGHACAEIAQRRLTQALRHDSGLSYQVPLAVEDLGDGLMHTWLAADALPDHVPAAAHKMLSTFEDFVAEGCTWAELAAYRERLSESYSSPSALPSALTRQAVAILNGQQWSVEGTLAEAADLTPETTQLVARELHGSMIAAVPSALPVVSGRMGRLPLWSSRVITGTSRWAVDSAAMLTLGDDGIMLTPQARRNVTVRYADAVALMRWTDSKLAVVGADGFTVQLDPEEWPGGDKLAAEVAGRLPPELLIPLDGPGRPRSGRGTATGTPSPARRRAGWRTWVVRSLRVVYGLVALCGVLAITGGAVAGGVAFLIVGLAALAGQEYRLRRRRRQRQPAPPGG